MGLVEIETFLPNRYKNMPTLGFFHVSVKGWITIGSRDNPVQNILDIFFLFFCGGEIHPALIKTIRDDALQVAMVMQS